MYAGLKMLMIVMIGYLDHRTKGNAFPVKFVAKLHSD